MGLECRTTKGLLEKGKRIAKMCCIVWHLELPMLLFNICSPMDISLVTIVNLETYGICAV